MSLNASTDAFAASGFPRVSGDEPTMCMFYETELAFSPRERG